MKKTNFDQYLEEQLKDPEFAARFDKAGQAWDVAVKAGIDWAKIKKIIFVFFMIDNG